MWMCVVDVWCGCGMWMCVVDVCSGCVVFHTSLWRWFTTAPSGDQPCPRSSSHYLAHKHFVLFFTRRFIFIIVVILLFVLFLLIVFIFLFYFLWRYFIVVFVIMLPQRLVVRNVDIISHVQLILPYHFCFTNKLLVILLYAHYHRDHFLLNVSLMGILKHFKLTVQIVFIIIIIIIIIV